MRGMNGRPFEGLISGRVSAVADKGDWLKFTVDTDGVIRTIYLEKSVAHIRVTENEITITEGSPNA